RYLGAPRHVHRIVHRHFHSPFLRVARGNGKSPVGAGVHVNRNAVQVGFLFRGRLYRAHFHHVLVPGLNAHRAIHIVEFQRSPGTQGIGLREFTRYTETLRSQENRDAQQNQGSGTKYAANHRRLSFANPFTPPRATTSSSYPHGTLLANSSVELKVKRYRSDNVNLFVAHLSWPRPL